MIMLCHRMRPPTDDFRTRKSIRLAPDDRPVPDSATPIVGNRLLEREVAQGTRLPRGGRESGLHGQPHDGRKTVGEDISPSSPEVEDAPVEAEPSPELQANEMDTTELVVEFETRPTGGALVYPLRPQDRASPPCGRR